MRRQLQVKVQTCIRTKLKISAKINKLIVTEESMPEEVKNQSSCVFCRELTGAGETNFGRHYPELSSRIVGTTKNLQAFPCIGQLKEGHFLVVTKAHVPTFREAVFANPAIWEEFNELVREVHKLLDLQLDNSLFFEHGAKCEEQGGCGIYHAHIHIVPEASHVNLRKYFPSFVQNNSSLITEAYSNLSKDQAYVMYGSSVHEFCSHPISEPLPSQTLRKLVASELDVSTWDWRQVGREKSMLNILNKAACA